MKLKFLLLLSFISISVSLKAMEVSEEDEIRLLMELSLEDHRDRQSAVNQDQDNDLDYAIALSLSQNFGNSNSFNPTGSNEIEEFEREEKFIKTHLRSNIYHSLPDHLKSKAIYYVKSKQLNGFSCGYNLLFNACNLENNLGFKNAYVNLKSFKDICTTYLSTENKGHIDYSTNFDLNNLANLLNLQKFQYFTADQYNIHPDVGTYSVAYSSNASQAEIRQLLAQEKSRRELIAIKNIKSFLDSNTSKTVVVHMGCHVISHGEPHVILVSLVQHKFGQRYLYIYDNVNDPILTGSEMDSYLQYFIEEFKISSRGF